MELVLLSYSESKKDWGCQSVSHRGQVAQEGVEVTEGLKMVGVHGIHESQLTEQEMVDSVGCLIQSCAQCSLPAQSSNVFLQSTLAQV